METNGLDFIEAVPQWKYISYDSNFVKFSEDPYSTPYWGRGANQILIKGDACYIEEFVFAQSPYGGFKGTLTHKINPNDGKLKWINYNNSYAGNKYREFYDYRSSYFDSDGNLNMIGLRSNDTMVKNIPAFWFYGTPIHKTIDDKTGLFKIIENCDSLTKYTKSVSFAEFEFLKNSDDEFFRVSFETEFIDSILHERIDFDALDEDLCWKEMPTKSIMHSTGYKTEDPFLSYTPLVSKFLNNTMLLVTGIKNPEDYTYSPIELRLNLVDFSNKHDIKIVKSKDIRDEINFPNYTIAEGIITRVIDNEILVYQLVGNKDTSLHSNRKIWLNWYDRDLNLVAKVDYWTNGTKIYTYGDIIGLANGFLYVAGRFSNTLSTGYDILRIKPGHNNIEYVSTLSIPKSANLTLQMFIGKVINEEKIIIPFRITGGATVDEVEHYYCFDLKDLGMDYVYTSEIFESKTLNISPNPASGSISLSCENNDASMIEVLDRLGRVVYRDKTSRCEEMSIDISGYASGLYFVRLMDRSGKVVGNGKFVKE